MCLVNKELAAVENIRSIAEVYKTTITFCSILVIYSGRPPKIDIVEGWEPSTIHVIIRLLKYIHN